MRSAHSAGRAFATAFASAFGLAAALAAAPPALAASWSLGYIGQQVLATGASFGGTTIGGLSGIDYDAATQQYRAISDDRSQFDPARFYTLTLDLSQFNTQASPGAAGVAFTGVTTLRDTSGAAFGAGQVDPEAIRQVGDRLIWSSEGERAGSNRQDPFVREARLDGTFVSSYAVPGYYGTATDGVGIRQNLAFESVAVSGDTVYTATENALLQDGPASAVGVVSPSRVLAFDRGTGNAVGEYLYRVDAVSAAGGIGGNGLAELLAVPDADGRFIALERSFSTGLGVGIKLYLTSLAGATNFLGESVLPADAQAMDKELLLDLGTLAMNLGIGLDNIEGITFGPERNGRQTLVLVSDNNFSGAQVTQFLAFEVTVVPEPQAWLMLLCGLGVLAASRRPALSRRRSGGPASVRP